MSKGQGVQQRWVVGSQSRAVINFWVDHHVIVTLAVGQGSKTTTGKYVVVQGLEQLGELQVSRASCGDTKEQQREEGSC